MHAQKGDFLCLFIFFSKSQNVLDVFTSVCSNDEEFVNYILKSA